MNPSFWAALAAATSFHGPQTAPVPVPSAEVRCSDFVGDGDAKEAEAALSACNEALASRIDPRLAYQKGRALYFLERDAEALAAYQIAHQGGYAMATTQVAVMHHEGYGVAKDPVKALELYKRGLAGGDSSAAVGLANLLSEGGVIPKDLVAAAGYWRRAADAGLPEGELGLGFAYQNGLGVEKDLTRAVQLYGSAAAKGESQSQYNLGVLSLQGTGVPLDLTEALRWFRLSAENGSLDGIFEVGRAYAEGRGTAKDPVEAERWYRRGIAAGDEVNSPNSLAYLFALQGRNLEEASGLAEKALKASPRNTAVMDTLGLIRFRQKRLPEAAALMEETVKLKPETALYHARLGDIYAAIGRRSEARSAWRRALRALAQSPENQEITAAELRRRLRR